MAALIALKSFEEAEPLAIECYERHARVLGPSHKNSRAAIELLVELYQGWGKPEKADQYRELMPQG